MRVEVFKLTKQVGRVKDPTNVIISVLEQFKRCFQGFFCFGGAKMSCNDFKCVFEIDGLCEADTGNCIGDMCENWGECINCQQQGEDECDGLKSL